MTKPKSSRQNQNSTENQKAHGNNKKSSRPRVLDTTCDVIARVVGNKSNMAASRSNMFYSNKLSRAIFDNPDVHRYVPSPHNQRIEGWWSFYSKNQSSWWRNFFQDLEADGKIDMTSEMNKECLWYCFSGVLQADCDAVKEHWIVIN